MYIHADPQLNSFMSYNICQLRIQHEVWKKFLHDLK